MSMRQLWEGSEAAPWIQKLTGKTKLIWLFAFSILMITVDNPRTLFILFSFSLLLHLFAKISWAKWQVMAVLLLLSLWGSVLSQALFFSQTPRTPLFVLISPEMPYLGNLTNGLYIYREGIIYGAVQGLHSATMLCLGLLICWTSDVRQLLNAFLAWHLPHQVAFMLVTAIRFLPSLASEAGEVLIALRLRSAGKLGHTSIIQHLPYIAKPLLARSLRRAQTLALSVVSRGFFLAKQQHRALAWPLQERLSCWTLVILTALIVFSKIAYGLAEQGFYFGALRLAYDWTKLYL